MKLYAACLGAAAGLAVASMAHAAVDGSKPVICATVDVMECVPGGSCQRVGAEEVGMPRFIRVDFAAKQITYVHPDGEDVSSEIERRETVDGRLVLQGAEDGFEDVRDGIGWSLSIDQESGNMVLTGSGAEVAFAIFGACTTF